MNERNVNEEELVFGLDIGTRSIVGTVGYRQGERFVVVAQEIRQHETRAMLDGQIHDINRVSAIIADIAQALQAKVGVKMDEVCIAAAGRVLKTMNVHVDMDLDKERNVTKEDMSNLISLGIEQAFSDFQEKNDTNLHFYCVGYSVVKYYLNGMWMGQPEHHKAKNLGADMIATFLPDDAVDGLYSAVELAGLRVANLTLEPIAAIRVAIPEKFRLLNIAMIDVGAGTSDISITDDGSVIAFGMIPCAGDTLTELLAKTCLIDFSTAEMIKTAATQQDEIEYEDIMGMQQTISAKEVIAICQPEIERMSKLAANAIKELN
ncbi:MAG TPA: cell division protein FtsA, partial [Lachnospiraceae bacterium]|nr:cell division protein FtsA [Lachnospiraceae bacterium]